MWFGDQTIFLILLGGLGPETASICMFLMLQPVNSQQQTIIYGTLEMALKIQQLPLITAIIICSVLELCCSGVNSTYYTVVGAATSITGPYLDENGVDLNSGGGTTILTGAGTEVAAGGADIFDDGTTKQLAYHFYDANNAGSETLNVRTLFFGNSPRTGETADWINVSAPLFTPITGGTVTASSSVENYGWLKTKVNDGQESSISGAMGSRQQ